MFTVEKYLISRQRKRINQGGKKCTEEKNVSAQTRDIYSEEEKKKRGKEQKSKNKKLKNIKEIDREGLHVRVKERNERTFSLFSRSPTAVLNLRVHRCGGPRKINNKKISVSDIAMIG